MGLAYEDDFATVLLPLRYRLDGSQLVLDRAATLAGLKALAAVYAQAAKQPKRPITGALAAAAAAYAGGCN